MLGRLFSRRSMSIWAFLFFFFMQTLLPIREVIKVLIHNDIFPDIFLWIKLSFFVASLSAAAYFGIIVFKKFFIILNVLLLVFLGYYGVLFRFIKLTFLVLEKLTLFSLLACCHWGSDTSIIYWETRWKRRSIPICSSCIRAGSTLEAWFYALIMVNIREWRHISAASGPKVNITARIVSPIVLCSSFIAARGWTSVLIGRYWRNFIKIICLLRSYAFIILPASIVWIDF